MSAMGSQKRKIAIRYSHRIAIIRGAYKPEEFMKHRVHKKHIERFLNEERAKELHESLQQVGVGV